MCVIIAVPPSPSHVGVYKLFPAEGSKQRFTVEPGGLIVIALMSVPGGAR